MTTTTRTSELEAINTMLAAAGESPVSSLEVSGLEDVANAIKTLNETTRSVQTLGWHFNTEDDYVMSRDVAGQIQLPLNVIKIDTMPEHSTFDVVQRGDKLYDKKTHSYIFTQDLKCSVVFLLDWTDLPQAARTYIMIKAARIFQCRSLGSDTQHRFSEREEYDALVALQEAEGETGDYNMLTDSYSVANIWYR